MLESQIRLWYKFFRADDAGIRKIPRAVPESIAATEFKLPLALLFKNPVSNYLPAG